MRHHYNKIMQDKLSEINVAKFTVPRHSGGTINVTSFVGYHSPLKSNLSSSDALLKLYSKGQIYCFYFITLPVP